jgi:hypothetical protein
VGDALGAAREGALDFHSVSVLVLFVAVFFIATMPRAGKVQEGPRTGSVRPLLRTSTIVEGI